MIEPPQNFRYSPVTLRIIWDAVPNAIKYEIAWSSDNGATWDSKITDDSSNNIPFNEPAGAYKLKGKTQGSGGWGVWGDVEDVEII